MTEHLVSQADYDLRYVLVALSESLQEQISLDNKFLVWDYCDHNEIGLAFDQLLYALFDESAGPITLAPDQAATILQLGKALVQKGESDIVYKIFLQRYFPQEIGEALKE